MRYFDRTDQRGLDLGAVVVAAGAGTPELLRPLGVKVSNRFFHHARFTFPLRDPRSRPPCWQDRSESWGEGFTSYGQLCAPGRWTVGGSLPAQCMDWDLDPAEATARARSAITDYVRDRGADCEPEVAETIYCNTTVRVTASPPHQCGALLAVWGDNLFKLAPSIATSVARSPGDVGRPSLNRRSVFDV